MNLTSVLDESWTPGKRRQPPGWKSSGGGQAASVWEEEHPEKTLPTYFTKKIASGGRGRWVLAGSRCTIL